MRNGERHLTREELLLFLDEEMNAKASMQAETHLARCGECSTALEEIEAALKQVDAVYRAEGFQAREEDGQRSLLRMRLQQEAKRDRLRWSWSPLQQPMIYAAAALLIATLSMGWIHHRAMQQGVAYAEDHPMPNPRLTPGAVRQVAYAEICPAQDDDKDPAVPAEIQQAVFKEYGVRQATRTQKFQVDYLINPQLGGTGEMRNLWPQPYESTVWNADVKDALEDRLHAMVCQREIDLPQAQRELATDWIGAYKKYFHTQTPLREQARIMPPSGSEGHAGEFNELRVINR
jgi:hypothetical protein